MTKELTRWTAFICLFGLCLCLDRIIKPLATGEATQKLSNSLNTFGLELYKQIIKQESNIVLSPFGISLLLSALLVGSRGKTATELNQTLHYDNVDLEEMTTAFHDIFIQQNMVGYEMDMYKAMFFQKGVQIDSTFGDIVGRLLMVEGKMVDFNDPGSTDKLNAYVSEGSKEKIPKIFDGPFEKDTQVLLVNAMTFSGVWLKQFDPSRTKNSSFYCKGKSEPKSVATMNIESEFAHADDDDLQAELVKLPYDQEEGHMILVLPRIRNGLTSLEKSLTLEHLQKAIESMKPKKVNLTVPKFTIKNTYGMKPALQKMGLRRVFDNKTADFFGLVGVDGMSITDVHQKNTVELNEKGTVASSGGVISPRSKDSEKVSFNVDHPFLYLIQDKVTKIFFFIGHIITL